MILEGKAYWAAITVPNTRYEPAWQVDLVVSDEVADDFESRGFKVKDKDYGRCLTIKRKVNRKDGTQRPTPKLMDAKKNVIDEAIGNGSDVLVQCREWEMGEYQGLELQAVQIVNLVPYAGADGEEFEELETEEDDSDGEEL